VSLPPATPTDPLDRQRSVSSPPTLPIPLPIQRPDVHDAVPAVAAAWAATVGAAGSTPLHRRLVAALRTPRGAGTAATLAGAGLALVVGLTTSPPSGVMELDTRPPDLPAPTLAGPTGIGPSDVTVRLSAAGARAGDGRAAGGALTEVAAVEASPVAGSLPPGCPPTAIRVWTPPGPLTLDAGVGVPVGVSLAPDAPAACRRDAMTLTVAGTVTVSGAGGQPVRIPVTGSVAFSPSR